MTEQHRPAVTMRRFKQPPVCACMHACLPACLPARVHACVRACVLAEPQSHRQARLKALPGFVCRVSAAEPKPDLQAS